MVDTRKILKFAEAFVDIAELESSLWDGVSTPTFQDQVFAPQTSDAKPVQLSERTKAKIAELHPEFQKDITRLMMYALAVGLKPEIVEGHRTQERQEELYEQGRTKPGQIVTKTKKSKHTEGKAVDIASLDENGNITYSPEDTSFWDKMGAIARSLGITWGGDWVSIKDRPHFQYKEK